MILGAGKVTPGGQSGPLGNNWARWYALEQCFGWMSLASLQRLVPAFTSPFSPLLFPAPPVCEVVHSFLKGMRQVQK